ncbi:hypothetical protein [Anatilimnocola floriformis]|uniref:hypothetical protein n=1 Tax=Anatilimnocola floriformis TaxID=2948575 RepID=UPI0020C5833A|nr:hypothetical protein [Anatilimnocola floriformis]
MGYSANVEIRLEVEGVILDVAQVGRDSLILREPYESPITAGARVVITVDGREHIHPIFLHQGISKDSREVNFC